jgi:hypothetical protein
LQPVKVLIKIYIELRKKPVGNGIGIGYFEVYTRSALPDIPDAKS